MNEAICLCLQGEISPPVALSRMLLAGMDTAAITAAFAAARPANASATWHSLAGLLEGRMAVLDRLVAEIRQTGSDHTALGGIAGIAAFFDRAVTHSPEAGVALYSLGDPAILQAATAEITDWLTAGGWLPPGAAVLDLGCGMGRVAAALASHCRTVLGLDVSPGMIAEARRRHASLPQLRFEVTDGRSIPPGPYDLVLLVDSMPYVLQAGLADRVVSTCTAALRPHGSLVILNLSYGRDASADRADAARWSTAYGLRLAASTPFKLWDGRAFVLSRGL